MEHNFVDNDVIQSFKSRLQPSKINNYHSMIKRSLIALNQINGIAVTPISSPQPTYDLDTLTVSLVCEYSSITANHFKTVMKKLGFKADYKLHHRSVLINDSGKCRLQVMPTVELQVKQLNPLDQNKFIRAIEKASTII